MLNKVQLIGFLGGDPEVRYTNDSEAIARVNIATSESWKKDGEKHEKTEWPAWFSSENSRKSSVSI